MIKITLEYITYNWSKTDEIIYKTPEIKLASLLAGKSSQRVKYVSVFKMAE